MSSQTKIIMFGLILVCISVGGLIGFFLPQHFELGGFLLSLSVGVGMIIAALLFFSPH